MSSLHEQNVEQLIISCRTGDEASFEEIVRRFEPMLASIAGSFSLDFRDVYSEACFSLRRAVETYTLDGKVTFGLYAKICVTHAVIDYAKKVKSSVPTVEFDVSDIPVSDGIQSRLEREEERELLLDSARKLLSDYEYDVFLLCLRGDKTAEIARKLGKSAKSVDNAKARMLKTLRKGLGSVSDV